MKAKRITPEQFVTVWQTSQTVDEVVQRLCKMSGRKLEKRSCVSRASIYRKAGVKLKRF